MLEEFVVGQIYAFILIFVRMGAGIMILPGIGEAYVTPRARLLFAVMVALLLTPVFENQFGTIPGSPFSLGVLIIAEVMVGVFMGLLARVLVSTMHVAGMVISYQSSLALATVFDNSQGSQTTIIGNFLTLLSVVMFFSLNLHHVMLQGLADSYSIFPPGEFPPVADFANHMARMVSDVFIMGIKIAAPHMVISLVFYTGAGVLGRLMPTMQVFFVLMPAQILFAFFLLGAILTDIMFDYTGFVETELMRFLGQ